MKHHFTHFFLRLEGKETVRKAHYVEKQDRITICSIVLTRK